jgi:Ni,Fe-hydrogenase maturation factor
MAGPRTASPCRGEAAARAEDAVLLIAIGNPLRGDDGAAQHVAEGLAGVPGVCIRQEQQLLPELAAEMVHFRTVVFVDADVRAQRATLEPLAKRAPEGGMPGQRGAWAGGHHGSPEALLALARELFGWRGTAWVCRLPAACFDPGERVSEVAAGGAGEGARLLKDMLARAGAMDATGGCGN